jgi:hypothetical protein
MVRWRRRRKEVVPSRDFEGREPPIRLAAEHVLCAKPAEGVESGIFHKLVPLATGATVAAGSRASPACYPPLLEAPKRTRSFARSWSRHSRDPAKVPLHFSGRLRVRHLNRLSKLQQQLFCKPRLRMPQFSAWEPARPRACGPASRC